MGRQRLSIDNDFQRQPSSDHDGIFYRVRVQSLMRSVDLFWPGDEKRFRESLDPNKYRITKEVLEKAVNRTLESKELDLDKTEPAVPTVNICDSDFD
jgi:hypothetical protein